MKISYLPEVVSPTGATVFPITTGGVSKKVQLTTLNGFSGSGTVGNVFAGQNVKLNPSPATTTSVVSFSFPGSIFPFPSNNAPDGWLLCNGQAVSRQVYSTLFDVVGVTYGSGDNRTTFNLPDLRGRVVTGRETMGGVATSGRLTNTRPGNVDGSVLGAVGGEDLHVLTFSESSIRSHTHTYSAATTIYSGRQTVDDRSSGPSAASPGTGYCCVNMSYQFTTTASSDSSATGHNNLPPLVFFNWVIKF